MSSQEMLEKAIQKAIDGGWKAYYGGKGIGWADVEAVISYYKLANDDWYEQQEDGYEHFIFNHDFAKALWGEMLISSCCRVPIYRHDHPGSMWRCPKDDEILVDGLYSEIAFKYHLQQMVIADDPIKYLEHNI